MCVDYIIGVDIVRMNILDKVEFHWGKRFKPTLAGIDVISNVEFGIDIRPYERLREYRLGVTFQQTGWWPESRSYDELVHRFKQALRLEIYGDLEKRLYEVWYKIRSQDFVEVDALMSDIMKEVRGE